MNKLRNSQIFRYVMTGGMTTLINYIIFFLLTTVSLNYLISNSIAWLGAVIFAFYANRQVVFHSDGDKMQEFLQFFSLRLATLVVENLLLFLFVEWMVMPEMVSKIFVSVVTVALNYFACKYSIFKERGVSHE